MYVENVKKNGRSKMEKVLKHILNGNKIEDRVGDVWSLSHIVLFNGEVYEDYKIVDIVDDFIVHVTPEQKEIGELKALVELMTTEMAKLREAKSITSKPAYHHLEAGEIKEIEDIMIKHPGITSTVIMKTYTTSQAVISRIRRAIHPRSSESYKAYVMKQDLGA